jgi:hypothetical protein
MLVFQYEKCRAEFRRRAGKKPGEYSYRYGRRIMMPEASLTIIDSEPQELSGSPRNIHHFPADPLKGFLPGSAALAA